MMRTATATSNYVERDDYDVEGYLILALLPCEVAEEDHCVVVVGSDQAGESGGVLFRGKGTRMERQAMSMLWKCFARSVSII